MGRPTLAATDRARGLFLGLAASHQRGLGGGRDAVWGDHVALAALLAEELLQPSVDLRRVVREWIAWWRRDGRGLDAHTAEALEHLAQHDAPAAPKAGGSGAGPLARTLPVALAMYRSPRNLVSGTYHTVLLTHADSDTAWAAVAVNVAAAQFLHGRRDFLPDVVEVLQANDASPNLLALVRRIPFIGRDELAPAGHSPALACAELALWCAHHEPDLERGVVWALGRGPDRATHAAVVGGLLGARDGEDAIPADWVASVAASETLRGYAKRLVALRPAGAGGQ